LRRFYSNRLTGILPDPISTHENRPVIQGLFSTLLNNYLDDAVARTFEDKTAKDISEEIIIDERLCKNLH
jgi:hypothetical protein